MLYPKTFYCKITDPSCTIPIKVDIDKCKTISDLQTQIALDLHISESDFQISNPYNKQSLIEIPSQFELIINIFNRCYNIDFVFPDYSRIQIPNSYRMTFEDIFDYFSQRQIYFPSTSKQILQFTVSNHELPNIKYPFLAIPPLTPVQINLPYQPVFITHGNKKFIFTENESASQCTSEIQSFYPSSSLVLLRDGLGQRVDFWIKLDCSEKYQISVFFEVPFRSVDNSMFFTKKMESLATVNDARREVAKKCQNVQPEDIIIYNNEKRVICGTLTPLESEQCLSTTFYFEIEGDVGCGGDGCGELHFDSNSDDDDSDDSRKMRRPDKY